MQARAHVNIIHRAAAFARVGAIVATPVKSCAFISNSCGFCRLIRSITVEIVGIITVRPMRRGVILVAFCSAEFLAIAAGINTDYITPPFTFSPDQRYGVMIPVFHIESNDPDNRLNKVVELATGQVVAVIRAEPGYDRALNFHETAPPRWSVDSTLLLWKVDGKWNPDALVLLKIEQNRAKWQLDLLKTAQQAVLSRTGKAAPRQYEIAKKANAGSGSAFPDGFTIDVTTDDENSKAVSLPLRVQADLSANPKQIENFPNLDSHLDAVVTKDGKFAVQDFHLGSRKQW